MSRHRLDPDSEAAVEMVQAEQRREEIAELEGKYREKLIAQVNQVIGRVQANHLMAKFADVSSLIWLKQIKESKLYRDVPGIGSWESFCNCAGVSRQHVDEQLQNLNVLGEEFLLTCQQFSVGYRELRKLRYAAKQGDLVIDSQAVIIGEDKIPLSPDHAEDLEAAIESLLESKNKQLEEAEAVIRAKDRVLAAKDELIKKQEKELAKHEKRLKEKNLAPGEEAFLQQLADLKALFDLWESKIGLDVVDLNDASPRMKAAYIETLGYIARIADELYQNAVDAYGTPTVDSDGWIPPTERPDYEGTTNTIN